MRTVLKWAVAGVGVALISGVLASLFLDKKQASQGIEDAQIQAKSYETKELNLGEVTVSVTPIRMEVGEQAEFEVKFDTHSVDLNFDVSKISLLTDGAGNSLGGPIWEGSPPGGHHLEGKLKFDEPIGGPTDNLKLVFEKVFEGEDIVFTWKID